MDERVLEDKKANDMGQLWQRTEDMEHSDMKERDLGVRKRDDRDRRRIK
jgi:hypothetical protein